jgi:hypothetical protein
MDELTKIALVGTSRHAGALPIDDAIATLLPDFSGDDREEQTLVQAGTKSIYGMAGGRPLADVGAVDPALPETERAASRKLAGLLQNALAAGAGDLLIEFLRRMQASRVLLPPDLLPEMLVCSDAEVRRQMLTVLGERGLWLSRQNPDWSWVEKGVSHLTEADQNELARVWDQGAIAERCQALAVLRRCDSGAARGWLSQIFSREKPNHRVNLLEAFETGLSADDEAFLEECLADRSSSVVQMAARLLCRLPNSALAGRMRARGEALLSVEKKGFLRKKPRLVCTPPEKIDRDWERDGVPAKAPAGKGLRAFWAETTLAAIPPSHWPEHLGLAPAALIESVAEDSFEDAVLAGWTQAATRYAAGDAGSAEWLLPLWQHWAGAAGRMKGRGRADALERLKGLLPAMSREQAEQGLRELFETAQKTDDVESLALVPLVPRPWSADFGRRFLAIVRQILKKRSDNAAYQWAGALFTAARAIPAEVFPTALAPWEVPESGASAAWHVNALQREVDKFIETVQTRQSFLEEINLGQTAEHQSIDNRAESGH